MLSDGVLWDQRRRHRVIPGLRNLDLTEADVDEGHAVARRIMAKDSRCADYADVSVFVGQLDGHELVWAQIIPMWNVELIAKLRAQVELAELELVIAVEVEAYPAGRRQ